MSRRQVLRLGALLMLLGIAPGCRETESGRFAGTRRIVSLAPAVTETLFAIGAGKDVIAISDYCDTPVEALSRPRVGTSITPNYEAIARLRPSLIVSESNASTRKRELEALAPTRLLPWLTLHEIAAGIRELGALSDRKPSADSLAVELIRALDVREPTSGPRVLMLLGGDGGPDNELWFIRKNSLHGAALHAAGARNAVAEEVKGPPQLSFERLLSLDPDAILILARPSRGADQRGALRTNLERFVTLSAVQRGRISVVEAPEAYANGPRILALVGKLRTALGRLGVLG